MEKWMAEYEKQLRLAVQQNPNEYIWLESEVPAVAARMREAFARGTYSKDGQAIRATCKVLGVKWTYKAINEFLKGGGE